MKKVIRFALLDFDGTLITQDILDILCAVVGKEKESRESNAAFHRGELPGLSALIKRINYLEGMPKSQIREALAQNTYLMPGAEELMQYFKANKIVTILASGNIVPVLEVYQQILGIDHVVGSEPQMRDDVLIGISETAFSSKSFKIDGIQRILSNYEDVRKDQIIALGDSPSDKGMFQLSSYSFAVNPKGDIAEYADAVVHNDLREVVKLLESA